MSRLARFVGLCAGSLLLVAGCGSSGEEGRGDTQSAPASVTQEATVCDDPCMGLLQEATAVEACFDAGGSLCLDLLTDVYMTAESVRENPSPGYGELTQEYAFGELVAGEQFAAESAELRCFERAADDAECLDVVGKSIERYVAGAKALATGTIPL